MLKVLIFLALLATVLVMFIGTMSKSGRGPVDTRFSEYTMYLRIGLQALTILLLLIALLFA